MKDNMQHPSKYEAGYSLLSTAAMLVVLGLGTSAGMSLYKNQDAQKKIQKNRDIQQSAKKALEDYFAKNGRYPCPAPLDASVDSAAAGKEVSATCPDSTSFSGTYEVIGRGSGTVRIGALPTRTLNVDDAIGIDAWGSKIIYAVTSSYARPGVPTGDDGAISIVDSSGTDVTSTPGNVIYTIVLPGKDKRGMFSLNGVQDAQACNITVPAGENCDFNNATFYASITQLNDSDTGQQYTAALDYVSSNKAYSWNTSAWGPCPCGSTTQTRAVSCVVAVQNTPVPNAACANAGPIPVSTQACTPVCPPSPPPWAGGGGGGGGGGGPRSVDTDGDGVGDVRTSDPRAAGGVEVDGPCGSCDGPSGGGGGGSGGSTRVICTHFFRKGWIDRDVWLADLQFTAEYLPRATVRGYHFWAIPYVRLMRKSNLAEKFMWPLANHRAEELAYQMGVRSKPNYLGKIIRATLEPVCFVIGLFVKEQNYKSLYTARELRMLQNL